MMMMMRRRRRIWWGHVGSALANAQLTGPGRNRYPNLVKLLIATRSNLVPVCRCGPDLAFEYNPDVRQLRFEDRNCA